MKGVVFTELIEFVEDRLGLEVADRMIEQANVPNQGAYTAVGSYDYHELLQLVQALNEITGIATTHLVKNFGRHLFQQFTQSCPHYVAGIQSTTDLMPHLERYIHVEVRKLNPGAELPSFECAQDLDGNLSVTYRSPRPFADLAEGLIEASIEHFQDALSLDREDLEAANGCVAKFTLKPFPEGV